MTTYILGAGPAGLAVADGLMDANAGPFVILERANVLGGLAQTVEWQGAGAHDLGPHKIFSLDKSLIERVEALLPASDWLTREKLSSIYMKGHYLPYPPSPFSLAGVFGLPAFIKMVMGYGIAKITAILSSTTPRSFEDDLSARMGAPLYNVLFKPIAEKLWGNPQELDVKLSKGRVQTPKLTEVLGRMLGLKKNSEFEALDFRYPKGGLGRIWQAIKDKSPGKGEFKLGTTVTGLETDGKSLITGIRIKSGETESTIAITADDFIVSSLPLSLATQLLAPSLPKDFPALAEKTIALNDLLLVFFHIEQPSLIKESWVFIPDKDIIFHRLSEQKSFDPGMTPNGSIVCCEIMSSKSRPLAGKSDDELCALAAKGLKDMGYSDFTIKSQRVIRLNKSYPVFNIGFEQGLAKLVQEIDRFQNFRTIGRQGAFNYIGTLDAMDIGYGFARWLADGRKQSWQQERERTNHYPVLD